MPDREAFLCTIAEHPDHDGPLLVFADWLEERGETVLAEFIRVRMEMRKPQRRERRHDLVRRQREILPTVKASWDSMRSEGARDLPLRVRHYAQSRFVSIASGIPQMLQTNDDNFDALTTFPISSVRIRPLLPFILTRLLNHPCARQVQSLRMSIYGGDVEEMINTILTGGRLALRDLYCGCHWQMTYSQDDHVRMVGALLREQSMQHLQSLSLLCMRMQNESLDALATPILQHPNLRSLEIDGNLREERIRKFMEQTQTRLRRLFISATRLPWEAMVRLRGQAKEMGMRLEL